MQIDSSEILKQGKKTVTVQARSLLCYWAIKEPGMTAVAVAKRVAKSMEKSTFGRALWYVIALFLDF
ncbi:MAG: hypothetical protein A2075_00825 [Geobacteraceae bacterium GWC2_58_44]|nr:MAG: hypothetical protein A2075_00825 [Geobacteraceae bacterium GWC2_58_44]HBG06239.1 hypothetical protein [Geobacter sp.]